MNDALAFKTTQGNSFALMPQLDDNSIDLGFMSPPYYMQRLYAEGFEQIYGGEAECIHEWIHVSAWRKATPGDVPGPGSDINSKRSNSENRPGKDSWYCKTCGAWKGDFGLEPDPFLYVKHLCDLFDLMKPKLRETGSLVVNIGDKMNDSGGAGGQYTKWRAKHTQFGKTVGGVGQCYPTRISSIPRSSHICVPEIFLLEMVYNRGWTCKRRLVWSKIDPLPSSATRNFTPSWESIYWFVKDSSKYYFKQQKIPLKHKDVRGNKFGGKKAAGYGNQIYSGREYNSMAGGGEKNRPDVLSIADDIRVTIEILEPSGEKMQDKDLIKMQTNKSREKHYATYPMLLPYIFIDALCPPDGTVFDPFHGIGQTGMATIAHNLVTHTNMTWIGFELVDMFKNICDRRLENPEIDQDFNRTRKRLLSRLTSRKIERTIDDLEMP